MVVGLFTVGSHINYKKFGYQNCHGADQNLIFAGLIYGSYLALFMEFYLKRYFGGSSGSSGGVVSKKNE